PAHHRSDAERTRGTLPDAKFQQEFRGYRQCADLVERNKRWRRRHKSHPDMPRAANRNRENAGAIDNRAVQDQYRSRKGRARGFPDERRALPANRSAMMVDA